MATDYNTAGLESLPSNEVAYTVPLPTPTPSPTPTPEATPTPCPCPTSAISSNFNGTRIPAGDAIWFNANFTASGIPKGGATIFLSGVALPLPSGLPGGVNPVTWSGSFSASAPGISVHWKWGAAVYTCFPAPDTAFYNSLMVKPTHNKACDFNNGDHAGTPENRAYRCDTGGARGGGAANLTGSWSGTGSVQQVCVP